MQGRTVRCPSLESGGGIRTLYTARSSSSSFSSTHTLRVYCTDDVCVCTVLSGPRAVLLPLPPSPPCCYTPSASLFASWASTGQKYGKERGGGGGGESTWANNRGREERQALCLEVGKQKRRESSRTFLVRPSVRPSACLLAADAGPLLLRSRRRSSRDPLFFPLSPLAVAIFLSYEISFCTFGIPPVFPSSFQDRRSEFLYHRPRLEVGTCSGLVT